ncbi:crotonase/enoyl-CoA hydratase family protein [Imbroritus primus]|uniref:crotonase/enoyl-CoA hydratase family protein n=1 Tax=Imbroritus primus TaxID=3058603 RepID=UPI003D161499
MSENLLLETRGNVLLMTLNRAHVRNAVDLETAEALAAALDQLETRDDLCMGILTGAGGTFCSGMDLKAFVGGRRANIPGRGFAGLAEKPPRKVLIAAVEGYALAGGFEIALACDLIVASRTAKFGLPEVKRGLVAAAGGLIRLPRRIPFHIAMEYVLTGDMLDADEAHAHGLVNQLTEPGHALEGALALARKIAANGPMALAISKQVLIESADWSRDDMFDRQREMTAPIFVSDDAIEGAAAFAQKRAPVWSGK